MMLDRIRQFVDLAADGWGKRVRLPLGYGQVSNVIICGMGGSGIAGDVIRDLLEDVSRKPIQVCKRPSLPAFADRNTLVISLSYSGDTAETISSLRDAISRRCKVIGITSGGRIEGLLRGKRLPWFEIPSGYLPREAMPYMVFLVLRLFRSLGWSSFAPRLDALRSRREEIEKDSRKIAARLRGKMVIVYTKYPSVAHRFKSQLNENSKTVAKYDIIPELFHNEINSWGRLQGNLHIVFMRDLHEPKVVTTMVEIAKKLLTRKRYTEIVASGAKRIDRMLYLIWMGDFVSYYLAIENGVEPERVYATEFLKSRLATTEEQEARRGTS